ncbi:MAG: hypothetical protein Q4A56_07615 [Porphyromonadaceae bacterium]|nr:hypothetical protein [Porphyromonadaceae bacterium]
MTTFSIRCSEELKERLQNNLENEATGNEKAEKIVNALVNAANIDRYEEEQSRLQAENERLQSVNSDLQLQTKSLQAANDSLQAENNGLQEKNKELKDVNIAIEEAYKKQLSEYATEGVMRFVVPEPARSLLDEYANRLNVKPEAILIDMFIRYVTEQYNHWFFDFLVKKSEFKDVCGYTHQEVLQWLNANK